MTLAVGGTLFTRMPVRLLAAVCDRRPRDLHYACWGGGLPLEMLLEAGAVTKATLCFSSLDIFGQAPRFQAAVQDGTIELIEWNAHAFAQALSAGKRRLPSEPFTLAGRVGPRRPADLPGSGRRPRDRHAHRSGPGPPTGRPAAPCAGGRRGRQHRARRVPGRWSS